MCVKTKAVSNLFVFVLFVQTMATVQILLPTWIPPTLQIRRQEEELLSVGITFANNRHT